MSFFVVVVIGSKLLSVDSNHRSVCCAFIVVTTVVVLDPRTITELITQYLPLGETWKTHRPCGLWCIALCVGSLSPELPSHGNYLASRFSPCSVRPIVYKTCQLRLIN